MPSSEQHIYLAPSTILSEEECYVSLIQQYLSLLLHDNATFLAERMIALNPSPRAAYLLSLCHYRSGSPKRARAVLLRYYRSSPDGCDKDNDVWPEGAHYPDENGRALRDSTTYLLAICCLELSMFVEAEECLLSRCRSRYRVVMEEEQLIKNKPKDIEEWILKTHPCPVPNGAAGLNLIGRACRLGKREKKAINYYRMSLKLDPMMWTSYEALCELGAASHNADDPPTIFGIIPSVLLSVPTSSGGYGEDSKCSIDKGEVEDEEMAYLNRTVLSSPVFSVTGSPILGGSSVENVYMNDFPLSTHPRDGEGGTTAVSYGYTTPSSAFSLSHNNFDVPGPTMTMNGQRNGLSLKSPFAKSSTTGVSIAEMEHLPSTTLFSTPNLTPIHRQTRRHLHLEQMSAIRYKVNPIESASCTVFANVGGGTSVSSACVLDRARRVASRLYYEASPESPLFHRVKLLQSLSSGRNAIDEDKGDITVTVRGDVPGNNMHETDKDLGERITGIAKYINRTMVVVDDMDKCNSPVLMGTNVDGGASSFSHDEGLKSILELLCTIGVAKRLLCQYRCHEAIHIYNLLPHSQFHTGYVLHQVGRAYFETADYHNAQRTFETMRQVDPYRMKGLEVLSTTLWHLKREVELSHLAQSTVDLDKSSAEAWIVVGNCFSLQNDHETALTFFRRSIQLDPTFTYAHTLSGHEYVANEDFDKAVACFRDAIRTDERHYNAWYGLGAIYFRQEKYDLAEYHFHRALAINCQSSVLHCHLGMAQYANGKPYDALDTLGNAFLLDPRNPQARYQRATIWMSMDRPHEALAEFEKVRDVVPREASVHFALGRVLKKLGRPEKAMKCFLTALDLDPKDNNLIKGAMDRLDELDIDEDVSSF